MSTRNTLLASLACCAATMSACAAEGPYNPDGLPADELGRVTGICQKVMGLSPDEPLEGGYRMGDDRLDYYTSHYRGCVVSLSDSLRNVNDRRLTEQADTDCRARGLQTGTPELAMCVLNSVNSPRRAASPVSTAVSALPVSQTFPGASGSFFYASPRENTRREQLACAALGFSPAEAAFASCVKGLSDTFYSIDHPVD